MFICVCTFECLCLKNNNGVCVYRGRWIIAAGADKTPVYRKLVSTCKTFNSNHSRDLKTSATLFKQFIFILCTVIRLCPFCVFFLK